MRYDRITRTEKPGSVFEKINWFPGHGTSQGYHRHPPLRKIQPTKADDPAPAGNRHPKGTDCGDEL